jgi:hypothetical protein
MPVPAVLSAERPEPLRMVLLLRRAATISICTATEAESLSPSDHRLFNTLVVHAAGWRRAIQDARQRSLGGKSTVEGEKEGAGASPSQLSDESQRLLLAPVTSSEHRRKNCGRSMLSGGLSPPRPPVKSSKGEALHTYLNRSKASLGFTR